MLEEGTSSYIRIGYLENDILTVLCNDPNVLLNTNGHKPKPLTLN